MIADRIQVVREHPTALFDYAAIADAIDNLVADARAEERAPLEKLLLDFAVPYTDKDEPGGVVDSKQWAKVCDAMHAIWRWYLARKNASRTSTP